MAVGTAFDEKVAAMRLNLNSRMRLADSEFDMLRAKVALQTDQPAMNNPTVTVGAPSMSPEQLATIVARLQSRRRDNQPTSLKNDVLLAPIGPVNLGPEERTL